jgi:alkylhydroperoxidase family enzyme
MARVPLIEEEDHPELADLIKRIKSGRRGSLLNVYKLLLHNPDVTEAWMGLIDAIRAKTMLDGRSRELAILRIANVNRSAYEMKQHVPKIALSAGLTLEECDAVARWPEPSSLDEKDEAVVAYADAVTREVHVDEAVFEKLRPHFGAREIVELTIIIGIYNMHGRVIEPLKIDPEPDH